MLLIAFSPLERSIKIIPAAFIYHPKKGILLNSFLAIKYIGLSTDIYIAIMSKLERWLAQNITGLFDLEIFSFPET
jgi:hypothetical protein